MSSTLMYGSEAAWRGHRYHQEEVQKVLNRMARSTLGTLPSTPVAFLESEGGSMPGFARLQLRQEAFAARVCASRYPSTKQEAEKGEGR